MSSPPIPVPTSGSRNSAYESQSHSHPSDSGNKLVLSPGTANKNPGLYMKFEVLRAVKMSLLVFWVVTPHGHLGRYHFRGKYCLHLQD
jgi:hypothetical protein